MIRATEFFILSAAGGCALAYLDHYAPRSVFRVAFLLAALAAFALVSWGMR